MRARPEGGPLALVCEMAYKFREELVGKRFLTVTGFSKIKVNKVNDWGWRAGVIRAASHRDNSSHELQVGAIFLIIIYSFIVGISTLFCFLFVELSYILFLFSVMIGLRETNILGISL